MLGVIFLAGIKSKQLPINRNGVSNALTMSTYDKELPTTPRFSQPQTLGYSDAKSDQGKTYGGVSSVRERENKELKEANERLQRQVQRLAIENNNLLDWKMQAEKEREHHQEILEIQKGALRDIMRYIGITVTECQTSVKQKQKQMDWEQRNPGHASLSMDTSMI